MTGRDPEFTAGVEPRYESQVYGAIAVAMNDAARDTRPNSAASDPEAAGRAPRHRFGFTELQSVAVMDMEFRRVTGIDREKIEQGRQKLAARVVVMAETRRILTPPGVPAHRVVLRSRVWGGMTQPQERPIHGSALCSVVEF
jgi:hypothetical protein